MEQKKLTYENYTKPEAKVYVITPEKVICLSGQGTEKMTESENDSEW